MSVSNKNKHLTAEERKIILNGIQNGSTKQAIAKVIGKDSSTVAKEIKLHRTCSYKCRMPLECNNYKKCKLGRNCTLQCIDYSPFTCKRRDRSPGACNGCSSYHSCRFDKFRYQPDIAHTEYAANLVSSRVGINATEDEIKRLGNQLLPLLLQGQSIYQILANNPAIGYSERTLYTYIETGVFKSVGIDIDAFKLRRQVNRKLPKSKVAGFKKRENRAFLKGREYKDFESFMTQHPDANVVEMDTVYNDGTNGPFLQTFKFLKYGFLFALYHEEKTAKAMKEGIDRLESILSSSVFKDEVEVILTDRGTEFSSANEMEKTNNETRRTRVFYCDPMCSHQKGSIENNHTQLRYILPKGTNLRSLGLQNQDDLNVVLSHINSFPKEQTKGKCPLEIIEFFHPDLAKLLNQFGIKKIMANEVILKPYLLKK